MSLTTAGQAGWAWQGTLEHRAVLGKVENGTVSGGGRLPRVREKHGMGLCKKDTSGQFVSDISQLWSHSSSPGAASPVHGPCRGLQKCLHHVWEISRWFF